MLERSPKRLDMGSTFAEAYDLVSEVAGDGGLVKTRIARIQSALKCSARRARALWNHEVGRIDAHEMDLLRQAAADAAQTKRERDVAGRYRELVERIACLEAKIREMDAASTNRHG